MIHTYETIYTEEQTEIPDSKECLDIEYLEIPSSDKKIYRELLCHSWPEIENFEQFQELENYHLTYMTSKQQKNRNGKVCIQWKPETTSIIKDLIGFDQETVEKLLISKKPISYEEVEQILIEDPINLIKIMKVLSNNYLFEIEKLKDKKNSTRELEDIIHNTKSFQFTLKEERIFFTGRTLIANLLKFQDNFFLESLLNDIDSVIATFNEGLIYKIISSLNIKLDPKEAFQDGSLGLVKAINKFEIDKNNKFSTYATWWIKQSILREYNNNYNQIKIPVYMSYRIRDFNNKKKKLSQNLGREVTNEEVLKSFSKRKRKGVSSALKVLGIVSLDSKLTDNNEDLEWYDIIKNNDLSIEELMQKEEIRKAIYEILQRANLSPTQLDILINRFGLYENDPKLLKELGEKYNISKEAVRQQEKTAIKRIAKEESIQNLV